MEAEVVCIDFRGDLIHYEVRKGSLLVIHLVEAHFVASLTLILVIVRFNEVFFRDSFLDGAGRL